MASFDKSNPLNLKQAAEHFDEILDDFAAGDWTPILVGKWGREPYMVILPYEMYQYLEKSIDEVREVKGK